MLSSRPLGRPARSKRGWRMARNGGAYVIAGHYTKPGDSTINAHEHINRALDIRGCWGKRGGPLPARLACARAVGARGAVGRIGAATYGLGSSTRRWRWLER